MAGDELDEQITTLLRRADQRYTKGRRALIAALRSIGQPVTIPQILEAGDGLAQSSVYRNLAILEEVGVEFINCRSIGIRSRKSLQMLDFSDALIYADTGISLLAAQIYGNDIDLIANGAREFERRGAQVVLEQHRHVVGRHVDGYGVSIGLDQLRDLLVDVADQDVHKGEASDQPAVAVHDV